MDKTLKAWMQKLPKAELHLHIEGAVPWAMVQAQIPDAVPDCPVWWHRDHRFVDFDDFVQVVRSFWHPFVGNVADIARVAEGIFVGLVAQNVKYVELSFGGGAYGFPPGEIAEAIKAVAPEGLVVKVFAGISRHRDLESAMWAGREAVGSASIDGIDLHGDERVGSVTPFASIFAVARERGLMTKAHAGELLGAESVRETVRVLKVQRIEHGVRAVEDPGVVDLLRDQNIVLDVCPWSNVKLQVSRDLKTHPLKALYEAGICVTLNTDDPTAFGQTLTDEYVWLYDKMGLSIEDVGKVAANGFRVADLPESAKRKWISEIELLCREFEDGC